MLSLKDVTIKTERQGRTDDGCVVYSSTARVSAEHSCRYQEEAFIGGEEACHSLAAYDAMQQLRDKLYGELSVLKDTMIAAMVNDDRDALYDLVGELEELLDD